MGEGQGWQIIGQRGEDMKEKDAAIYSAWQHGRSIGDLAKAYKLDKSQVKKVINRVSKESRVGNPEVVYELPTEEAGIGR